MRTVKDHLKQFVILLDDPDLNSGFVEYVDGGSEHKRKEYISKHIFRLQGNSDAGRLALSM